MNLSNTKINVFFLLNLTQIRENYQELLVNADPVDPSRTAEFILLRLTRGPKKYSRKYIDKLSCVQVYPSATLSSAAQLLKLARLFKYI